MANREENLKKINDELELMSDEELDKVAGGGTAQTCGDNDFLNYFGYANYKGALLFDVTWIKGSAMVDKGWSEAGVTCVTKFGCADNQYFINNKEVSRKDAFKHVLRKHGYDDWQIEHYDFNQWRGSF